MAKIQTQEQIDKINELYKKYGVMSDVAKEMGVSSSTIKKYLTQESLDYLNKDMENWDALWFYVYHLLGHYTDEEPVELKNVFCMMRYRRKGMSYRGQLLTMKYYYDVLGHRKDRIKGVWIIPQQYNNARYYYINQAKKADEIAKEIEEQLKQDRLEIRYNPKDYSHKQKQKRKKKEIDLSTIGKE